MSGDKTITTKDERYSSLRIKAGRIFKSVRVEKGFQQADVAEGMRLPRSALAMLENGRRSIKIEEFFELCDVLGVHAKDVFQRIKS
jgi:transcriptional regulator with XRE-family HTH domain